jgi:hypothetical protein
MRADDDGFIGNHKRIMKMINSNEDDLKVLLLKQFIIPFESGVCVIKHWKIHNYIRSDRYTKTHYSNEFDKLAIDCSGSYIKCDDKKNVIPNVIPTVDPGKDRLGKDRLGKDRLGKDSINIAIFETMWNMYDKKVDKKKALEKFKKIPESEYNKILSHIPNYVKSTPNKQYRKNFAVYLYNECWNNEIIIKKEAIPFNHRSAFIESLTPEIREEMESFKNEN